jgi:prepilin-type N-terminal cleavage/methylation domain-containing protein
VLKKSRGQKGFTLIEIMMVIAIIGILAAIAIPNFIAYRNKSFCSRAESDANRMASAIGNYFSIPKHNITPLLSDLNGGHGFTFSGSGTLINNGNLQGNDPNIHITITVRDGSDRCPDDYIQATPSWTDSGTRKVFTKLIKS